MSDFHFLKVSKSYLQDMRFLNLSSDEKWIYLGCYLLAGQASAEGAIANTTNEAMTAEEIAFTLRMDVELVKKNLDQLILKNFISIQDDFYFIVRYMDEQNCDEAKHDDIRKYWRVAQKKSYDKLKRKPKEDESKEQEKYKDEYKDKEKYKDQDEYKDEYKDKEEDEYKEKNERSQIDLIEDSIGNKQEQNDNNFSFSSQKPKVFDENNLRADTSYQKQFLMEFSRSVFVNENDKRLIEEAEKYDIDLSDLKLTYSYEEGLKMIQTKVDRAIDSEKNDLPF